VATLVNGFDLGSMVSTVAKAVTLPVVPAVTTEPIVTAEPAVTAETPSPPHHGGEIADRKRLLKHLFTDYDKRNYPTNTTLKFGVGLLGLDIDDGENTFETDLWLKYRWEDERLSWSEEEYPVQIIRLLPQEIWHPDIMLYNSVDLQEMMTCYPTKVMIYSTGEVLWKPRCHLNSHCEHTLKKDPYGPQTCSLHFGSWTFDSWSMNLVLFKDEDFAIMRDFRGSRSWDVLGNVANRNERYYSCCAEPYTSLFFNFTVQRSLTPFEDSHPDYAKWSPKVI